jgi:hypothetical protein
MNMRFKGMLSFAVLSSVLGLQGCSDGDSHVSQIASPAAVAAASLSGTAIKGVVANADCKVLNASQVEIFSTVGRAEPCTDANGAYDIELPTIPTGPVILELLARTGTSMKCDFPAGCGNGVAFGSDVSLGSDFSLRAVVPSVAEINEVNVTPWSELAVARVLQQATAGTPIVAANVQTAALEVAAVLNNLLGLEGSADAFGSDLLTISPVNLNAPTTGTASSETKKGSLLSLASASLFNLVGGSFTNIESVITGLGNAFEEDGQINVNDTATGIEADQGFDLASILDSIASTATGLTTVDSTIASTLNTLLGSTTNLTDVASEATSFSELKKAVADANADTTKPLTIAAATATDADKTKQLALDIDNMLAAGVVAFTPASGASSVVLQDLGEILEISDDIEKLENLFDLIEAANAMLTLGLSTPGCTVVADTSVTCTLPQAALLANAAQTGPKATNLNSGSGSLVYTVSNNTVLATNVVMGADSYALEQVGTSATVNTLKVASIDLGDDDTADISLGANSTMTGVFNSNNELTSFSVDANNIDVTIASMYSFEGDLAVTRNTTLRDTALSSFDMNGEFTVLRANDGLTNNQGATVATRLKFTTSLSGSTVPSFDGQSTEESASNFFTISDVVFQVQQDVAYNKRSFSGNEVAGTAVEETFVMLITGERDSFNLSDAKLRLSLIGEDSIVTLAGGVEIGATSETYTLSNGQAKASIVVGDTLEATLMVGTTNTGFIDEDGLVTVLTTFGFIEDDGTVTPTQTVQSLFQLGTWAGNVE